MCGNKNEILESEQFLLYTVWITTACNFKCTYCYEGLDKKQVVMTQETIEKLVCFIEKQCCEKEIYTVWLDFHGGEPLLCYEEIRSITNRLRSSRNVKKIHTSLTTNGFFYFDDISEYIDELTVSMDGTEDTHNLFRVDMLGRETFDTTFNNAKKYQKYYSELRVRMVVTPQNVNRLYEGVVFFLEEGFRVIVPGVDYYSQSWNDELFESLYLQLKRIENYRKEHIAHYTMIGIIDTKIKRKSRCIIGEDGLQIDPQGDIFPCIVTVGNPKYKLGNVYDGIDNSRIADIQCSLSGNIAECDGCTYYNYCTANRCVLINESITGDLFSPSENMCKTEQIILRLKGLL